MTPSVAEGWIALADGRWGRWADDGQPPEPAEAGHVVRSGAAFEEVRARTLAAAPRAARVRRRLLGDRAAAAQEYVVLLSAE